MKAPARAVADCAFCPKMCRFACPVAEAEASEAATPAWKGTLAHHFCGGRLPIPGPVAEAAYKCTDCLLSKTYCLHEHEVPESYAAVRAAAFRAGAAPARVASYDERVRGLGNPFAADLPAALARLVPPAELLRDGARSDVVLFPGFAATRHAPDATRDARAVVARVERAPLLCAASGAGCCGYPLHAAGDLEGFRAVARRTAAALAGAREVVSLDPGCVHTMNVLWPAADVQFRGRARTLVERLAERLDAVRAAVRAPLPAAETVAYHDPCFLGRYRGVYDAPRALLGAALGRPPAELSWSRERAWCSGAGAVYGKVDPASAARIADRRLAEHAESGARRLATACPSAQRMFAKARAPAAVVDVVTVLAEALGVDV